ncbi:MAG: hypothetical protein IJT83_01025, partial [Victivallales bacterium]|nr:hypothetical protein [Victivallales bacterium]
MCFLRKAEPAPLQVPAARGGASASTGACRARRSPRLYRCLPREAEPRASTGACRARRSPRFYRCLPRG